mgnify:CR=1 FL=1|tara:strand:- start:631 stop:900 length:270 start_codon:yes stop_codon:yes gene_type:complete
MSEKENTITVNNTEIKESELTNEQRYHAVQVQNLRHKKKLMQDKINELSLELDQINAALIHFEFGLKETTKEVAEKVLEKESKNTQGGK